jgi:NAD(P)-dependent dehydrogenase (short-subunit alcohol dehydrogenase family)
VNTARATYDFSGKVVAITGGSTGIGRATALAFGKAGAAVVLGNRNEVAAKEVAHEIAEAGGRALALRVDVTDEESVANLVTTAVSEFGGLHVAFNNAGGVTPPSPLHAMSSADFDHNIAIDLRGVFLAMKYELTHFLSAGGGVIVNTTSVAGLVPEKGSGAYVAAKHGVIGLTKSAGLEYADQNVRVNAVAPGWIETPMTEAFHHIPGFYEAMVAATPTHRAGTPEEVARLA